MPDEEKFERQVEPAPSLALVIKRAEALVKSSLEEVAGNAAEAALVDAEAPLSRAQHFFRGTKKDLALLSGAEETRIEGMREAIVLVKKSPDLWQAFDAVLKREVAYMKKIEAQAQANEIKPPSAAREREYEKWNNTREGITAVKYLLQEALERIEKIGNR